MGPPAPLWPCHERSDDDDRQNFASRFSSLLHLRLRYKIRHIYRSTDIVSLSGRAKVARWPEGKLNQPRPRSNRRAGKKYISNRWCVVDIARRTYNKIQQSVTHQSDSSLPNVTYTAYVTDVWIWAVGHTWWWHCAPPPSFSPYLTTISTRGSAPAARRVSGTLPRQ